MKRAQKLVLVSLALIDLAVISGLAFIVIRGSRRTPQLTQPTVAAPSPCASVLLDAFGDEGQNARVNWIEDGDADGALQLTLQLTHLTEASLTPTTPQLLWTMLDSLPRSLLDVCESPTTFTLLVSVTEDATIHRYTVDMTGETLGAWMRGSIDDVEFAARARYRESHGTAPE